MYTFSRIYTISIHHTTLSIDVVRSCIVRFTFTSLYSIFTPLCNITSHYAMFHHVVHHIISLYSDSRHIVLKSALLVIVMANFSCDVLYSRWVMYYPGLRTRPYLPVAHYGYQGKYHGYQGKYYRYLGKLHGSQGERLHLSTWC